MLLQSSVHRHSAVEEEGTNRSIDFADLHSQTHDRDCSL